jgi:hypothetical protein
LPGSLAACQTAADDVNHVGISSKFKVQSSKFKVQSSKFKVQKFKSSAAENTRSKLHNLQLTTNFEL